MNPNKKLSNISGDFLTNSSEIFDECSHGLTQLNKILVSTSQSLSGITRTHLTPMIYAYWERFFKVTFLEYLRCIGNAAIALEDVNEDLLKLNFRKQLRFGGERLKILNSPIYNIHNNLSLSSIKSLVEAINYDLKSPLYFSDQIEWIKVSAMVNIDFIKETCKRYKISFTKIVDAINCHPDLNFYRDLDNLVRARCDIAHGANLRDVSENKWNTYIDLVSKLMDIVQMTLYEHLSIDHPILKPTPEASTEAASNAQ